MRLKLAEMYGKFPYILTIKPKTMIKIQLGNNGFFLKVNGYCIKRNPYCSEGYGIKITKLDGIANNWYATEFASVKALREFWNENRIKIQLLIKMNKG